MTIPTLALLLATAAHAAPASAPAASPVSASTATAVAGSTLTVSSLYTGDRVRDPFLPPAMGGSSVRRPAGPKEDGVPEAPLDIHGLSLHGILKDAANDYALFTSDTGGTFMLRGTKLYNDRNKAVPGVTGRIKLKQKTVELMTPDKDVQVYRLGEEEEKNKEKQP
jgi:hypothetical protein